MGEAERALEPKSLSSFEHCAPGNAGLPVVGACGATGWPFMAPGRCERPIQGLSNLFARLRKNARRTAYTGVVEVELPGGCHQDHCGTHPGPTTNCG